MEQYFTYAFQAIICSGLFYGLYKLLLEGKTDYTFCRFYLIAGIILSAVIPVLKIPVFSGGVVELLAIPAIYSYDIAFDYTVVDELPAPARPPYMFITYLAISLFFVVRILTQLVRINRYTAKAKKTVRGGVKVYEGGTIKTPFAFFRRVFIPEGLEETEKQQILIHETSHADHNHGVEILLMEMLKAVFWFNPFIWLSRRALEQVHEYQADHAVIETGHDANNYKTLLFRQLLGYNPDISSGLACSKTKKRFIMMERSKPGPRTILRASAAIPLVGAMLMLFSFTTKDPVYIYTEEAAIDINSVIDAPGKMYYFIDGKEVTKEEVVNFDTNLIESLSITTDSEMFEKYGKAEISAGLVMVITKKAAQASPTDVPFYGEDVEIYLDNVLITPEEFKNVDPAEIHSISVLKDEETFSTSDPDNSPGTIHIYTKKYNEEHPQDSTHPLGMRISVSGDEGRISLDLDSGVITSTGYPEVSTNYPSATSRTEGRVILSEGGKILTADTLIYNLSRSASVNSDWTSAPDISQKLDIDKLQYSTAGSIIRVSNDKISIRVDGKEIDIDGMKNIASDAIESMSIVKDVEMLKNLDVHPNVEQLIEIRLKKDKNDTPEGMAIGSERTTKVDIKTAGDIPGDVQIIIDNVKSTEEDLKKINPGDIESISVFKDEARMSIYGVAPGINSVLVIKTKQEEPFIVVENMPKFRGGDLASFKQWVEKEVANNPASKSQNGTVNVTFIISREGKVEDVSVLSSTNNAQMARIAIEVITNSPHWTAGTQRGVAVPVRFNLPVKFGYGSDAEDKEPFTAVEEMAKSRAGDLTEFRHFVLEDIKYPVDTDQSLQGKGKKNGPRKRKVIRRGDH